MLQIFHFKWLRSKGTGNLGKKVESWPVAWPYSESHFQILILLSAVEWTSALKINPQSDYGKFSYDQRTEYKYQLDDVKVKVQLTKTGMSCWERRDKHQFPHLTKNGESEDAVGQTEQEIEIQAFGGEDWEEREGYMI